MEKKTTLNSAYLLLWKPQGLFIGTRGNEARGQTLAQSTDAARPYGSGNAAQAEFPRLF